MHVLYTPTFNHPVGMCFSSSFEAEIFELHESSYEVLPSGSTELLRPSDNNLKIPRIHQGQKHPLLFQMLNMEWINDLHHRMWKGIKLFSVVHCSENHVESWLSEPLICKIMFLDGLYLDKKYKSSNILP